MTQPAGLHDHLGPSMGTLRDDALTIWSAAVDAVRPATLIQGALEDPCIALRDTCASARRIIVVGAGKAGAAMAAAIEDGMIDLVPKISGLVNVPNESVRPLKAIKLHGARPAGVNFPTAEGVAGARQMLKMVAGAGPEDVVLCLISGGGSALLPAPADGITLEDKQQVTALLHACGATINEMNAVRKHLSDIKGGRLALDFYGRSMISLIISDVVGDLINVIASGPTVADPTTFADALAVLRKYQLVEKVPTRVRDRLQQGAASRSVRETLKSLPNRVHNFVVGNNRIALEAAERRAQQLGYHVLSTGSQDEGETQEAANVRVRMVLSMEKHGLLLTPACLLSGGETTVTLGAKHGKGGRNQEFVLAALVALGANALQNVVILSGGTDGEDGPTDAAGAVADLRTWRKAEELGLNPQDYLDRHDSYNFFHATGDLLRTGLTDTNVMDVRVILIK
jgi:hydroxypyruvate reductase/glycerate 2-kinase